MIRAALVALLLLPASPAVAGGGASGFTLVNGTSGALGDVSIRRAGTKDWKPLGAAPAAGARGAVKFSDPDCAFDIRANIAGGGPVGTAAWHSLLWALGIFLAFAPLAVRAYRRRT